MTETPAGGQMSDRMQALLSAAAEEQVREQRAVSTVLGELRGQVAALSDAVRAAASDATVERLGGVVSTVVSDLRTSTSLLGQRIEALSKRVDAVAADTAGPTEQAAVRLAALSAEISAQAEVVERMRSSLDQLSGFPGALAALQNDVAGLHDRLAPLAEVRSSINDLGARTAHSLEQLRPHVEGLQAKLDSLGTMPDAERLRDAVVDALGPRLDKLEQAAERPAIGPEALKAQFGDLRASLDSQAGERFDEVQTALGAIENRLGQVGQRIADVGDAAGGVPAVSSELARLHTRFDDLAAVREQVAKLAQGVSALQDDSTGTALTLGIASLRDDVERLTEQIGEQAPPPVEEIAALVSQRVADRLVETLAPRIADVVLTRVSAALVNQLGEALSPRVKADTEDIVRAATSESERRVLAHLDEAVLALAEALLRRRRGGRTTEAALEELGGALEEQAPAAASPPAEKPAEKAPSKAPAKAAEKPSVASAPVDDAGAEDERTQEGAGGEEPVEDVMDRLKAEPPTAQPTAQPPAQPQTAQPPPAEPSNARPAVTSSMAPPAPSATPPPPAPPAPVASAQVDNGDAAQGRTQEGVPAKKAPAKAPAKAAKAAAPPAKAPEKAPAKAPVKKAAAPVKKVVRPPTKPSVKPILERTPDVPDDDVDPVRDRPPQRFQRPATPPPGQRPTMAPPLQPPPAQPAAQPSAAPRSLPSPPAPPEPPKRKPWWRPGG